MDFYAFHAPSPDYLTEEGDRVLVRLHVPEGTPLRRAWVRSEPDNEEHLSPMHHLCTDGRWDVYQGELRLNPASDVSFYCFKMMVDGRQWWLDAVGLLPYFPERARHFRLNPSYRPASWVWSQVFYQIFPERFADGDPANNVESGEYLYGGKPVVAKRWDELPEHSQGPREFYGGDLAGIRQKLDYLQDLGVTALYLNPIFTSPSSHKYDTVDYTRIDPHFGTNASFAELCVELHERGMRIILDAVVNHTSEQHPWFDRYGKQSKPGAYCCRDADTRGFYVFGDEDDPESYVGWYGVRTLPVLDYRSPELRRRIYEADDAILRFWMRPPYRIDGWRFDVIHMVGEGAGATNNALYVRHFRDTLRQENPEAYVLGEHFFEATDWLQGDQEDAAMNYFGFGMPVRAFLAGIDHRGQGIQVDAQGFAHMLARARAPLPFAVQLSQFNLLGSHDTARFLTACKDPALARLAATLLFTYIGVPSIYYGDEIGLEGGEDPDCRRVFPWKESAWDQELRAHYRRLIALRRSSRALQEGAFIELFAHGDVYAFARQLGAETVITTVNRGDSELVDLPVWKLGLRDESLQTHFGGRPLRCRDGLLRLELSANSGEILLHTR